MWLNRNTGDGSELSKQSHSFFKANKLFDFDECNLFDFPVVSEPFPKQAVVLD